MGAAAATTEPPVHLGRSDGIATRLWARPLWQHGAALALLLLALVPFVGWGASFSADEGAAIIQAEHLSDGRGWFVGHPFPEVDPGSEAYPIELSFGVPGAFAPFAKHPLYAIALAGAHRVGGVAAMVLLSVIGTVAAAGLAALLARGLAPRLARPALWVTGLFTPLLFDAYLVIAHTLGAALAAAATFLVVRSLDRASRIGLIGACGFAAAGPFVRNESVLFAIALGVALAVAGGTALGRPRAIGWGAAIAGCGLAAQLVNAQLSAAVVGGAASGSGVPAGSGGSFVDDRITGFIVTWLLPSYRFDRGMALLFGAVLLGAVAGLVLRRRLLHRGRDLDDRLPVALLVGASALLVTRLVVEAPLPVPGLLVAVPFAVTALFLVDGTTLNRPGPRILAVTSALYVLAVLATQYRSGGSGEWGGRYFALVLPVVVPLLLSGLDRGLATLAPRGRHRALGALVVGSIAVSALAIGSLRVNHVDQERFFADVQRLTDLPAGDGGAPVVIATTGRTPRFAWPSFDERRWLLFDLDGEQIDAEGVRTLTEALAAAGIEQLAVVASSDDEVPDLVAETYDLLDRIQPRDEIDLEVLVYRLPDPDGS